MNDPNHTRPYLDVSISKQTLSVIDDGTVLRVYHVSTAKNGPGERMGSGCTPRGWHDIRAKIGEGQPVHSVFVGRRPTGEIYSSELANQFPQRDWILTRILWLGGLEPRKNRYGQVDTAWRYIYIHGSPDQSVNGKADSHGCIRLRNSDMMDLFAYVKIRDKVYIHE
jgi:lipoprotein-anchoring transpeptidase ErfK/SrfK